MNISREAHQKFLITLIDKTNQELKRHKAGDFIFECFPGEYEVYYKVIAVSLGAYSINRSWFSENVEITMVPSLKVEPIVKRYPGTRWDYYDGSVYSDLRGQNRVELIKFSEGGFKKQAGKEWYIPPSALPFYGVNGQPVYKSGHQYTEYEIQSSSGHNIKPVDNLQMMEVLNAFKKYKAMEQSREELERQKLIEREKQASQISSDSLNQLIDSI